MAGEQPERGEGCNGLRRRRESGACVPLRGNDARRRRGGAVFVTAWRLVSLQSRLLYHTATVTADVNGRRFAVVLRYVWWTAAFMVLVVIVAATFVKHLHLIDTYGTRSPLNTVVLLYFDSWAQQGSFLFYRAACLVPGIQHAIPIRVNSVCTHSIVVLLVAILA